MKKSTAIKIMRMVESGKTFVAMLEEVAMDDLAVVTTTEPAQIGTLSTVDNAGDLKTSEELNAGVVGQQDDPKTTTPPVVSHTALESDKKGMKEEDELLPPDDEGDEEEDVVEQAKKKLKETDATDLLPDTPDANKDEDDKLKMDPSPAVQIEQVDSAPEGTDDPAKIDGTIEPEVSPAVEPALESRFSRGISESSRNHWNLR